MVGREVELTVDRGESHPAGAGPRRSTGLHGRRRPRQRGRPRRRPRGPGRRDPRASPASPATARTSWSRRSSGCARSPAAGSRCRARTSPANAPREMNEAGVAYVPGRPPPVRAGPAVPARRQPRPDQLLPRAVRARDPARRRGHRQAAARGHRRSTTSGRPSADVLGRHAVGRQPAEGGRRARVRPRPEAAHPRPADARPRRRQHRVHPPPGDRGSATRGRRSCSSRPSSTRCSRCPTGSRSCTAAGSSRSSTGGRRTRTRSAC